MVTGRAPAGNRTLVAWRFAAEVAGRLATLLLFPLLARHLGAEGFGVQAQIVALTSMLVPLSTVGLGFSVVRFVAGLQDRRFVSVRMATTLLLIGGVSGALSLLVVIWAPWIDSLFFKTPDATRAVRVSAALVVLGALESVLTDYYRARLRIIAVSLLQIAQAACLVSGVWLVLAAGGRLPEVVAIWVAVKLLTVVGMLLYFYGVGEGGMVNELLPRAEILAMLRFGFPIVLISISGWVLSAGDRFLIGYFLGAREVGIYAAAYTLAALLGSLGSPFWGPLYPLMAGLKNQGQTDQLPGLCRKYSSAFLAVGLPALFGLTIVSADLLQLLGSTEFRVSVLLFATIAVGLFAEQTATPLHYLVLVHDEPWFLRNITILAGCVNVALNVLLIPVVGIAGAALATLLSYLLLDGVLLARVTGYGYGLSEVYDVRLIGRLVLAAAGMAVFVWWSRDGTVGVWSVSRAVLVGVTVYALLVLALPGTRAREVFNRSRRPGEV